MNVWAIIPARGGSKGVPRKNVAVLGGLPLMAYSIRAARAARQVSRVFVNTDDLEIAGVALDHGAEVPFLRPAELASDTASIGEALCHFFDRLEREEVAPPDGFVVLYPTNPFRTPALIDRVVSGLQRAFWVSTVAVESMDTGRFVTVRGGRIVSARPPGGGAALRRLGVAHAAHYGPRVLRGASITNAAERDEGLRFVEETRRRLRLPSSELHVPIDDPISCIDIDEPDDLALAQEVIRRGLFDFGISDVPNAAHCLSLPA